MADDDKDPFSVRMGASDIGAAYDVPVRVSTVIGKSQIQVAQLMRLTRGAVLELDRRVGSRLISTSITVWSPAGNWLSSTKIWV